MTTSATDPITFSVILNRLNSIATEMTLALEHAAMTPILALCRDYSCCIYDREARQVAMVDALPVHTSSMHLIIEEITRVFGDDLGEGDVIACNHAYSYNTHVGDLVTVCPVFHEGRHMFWAASKGHQLDVGAAVPASVHEWAPDIWSEGLQLPPIKLYHRGEPRRDVINMYLTNVRYRDLLEGDLMAQLGSIWTGERRLKELCDEFGSDTVEHYSHAALDYAEKRTRAAIREMPNGVYEAEGWMDTDGLDAHDVHVKVRVTIEDESVHVDFSGSAPQVPTGHNCSYAVAQAVGIAGVVTAIDPDIPHNEGCLRCVTVYAPEGTVCNASYPASTASATTQPADAMHDAVCKALAQAIPGQTRAGCSHWSNVPNLAGTRPGSGEPWGHLCLNGGGGGPAANGADGWPLVITNAALGGLKTASVEDTEQLYPVRIGRWEVATDSAGLGRWIGGPGIELEMWPTHTPIEWIHTNDSLVNPPHGVLGATPGRGGGHYLTADDGERRHFLPRAVHVAMQPGQRWTGVSTGGGGYGDPLDRPLEQVRADVRDGVVSRERAREVYGLMVDEALDPQIDEQATAAARTEIRAARSGEPLPTVTPTHPSASTWQRDEIRPQDTVIARALGAARIDA
ncbi:hydantoinase B/oxoprolinase family protein [Capillimicrobium parvum]|uniref:Acetophenone carboxylase delta subunit n=1 Tax=Capillimicrobium parvum TaxID=2884022 RepID=A0A9E6XWC8_9ACTN|nr:hydantoinase B/oxoprolinase family protein [Capillimicrobium parvum]UGS35628.1 Acetophenone carboxylase delta subunit [Capillimicrobium parvum]